MIESPCIKVCQKHTVDGLDYCVGCYRTMDEIVWWDQLEDHVKRHIIKLCENRRHNMHKNISTKGGHG